MSEEIKDEIVAPELTETPLKVEPALENVDEVDCLPCAALDQLCKILPEEEGKKACETIKIGLENDTMSAEEAREMLASKVGRVVLATKLAEVSDWITEQELRREENKQRIAETIPLEEEPITHLDVDLPPLPEEMTKSLDEIAPLISTPEAIPIEEPIIDEAVVDEIKHFYNPDDAIIYKDLDTTDYIDDPLYVYDDEDLFDDDWLKLGKIDDGD